MESPSACLSVVENQVYMKYYDISTLNSGNLQERTLLFPSPKLMEITNGYYVIYSYDTGGYMCDSRRNVRDIKALKYQITNIYCYGKGSRCVIAKFADTNFTERIDITPDDIVVGLMGKKFSPELAEQILMYKAQ